MDRINGRLPKDAIVNQAKLENKNVCCKFSLKFFSKLASTNNTFNKLYLNNIVKESLGYLECKLYKTYNVGDHYLVLHKVKSFKILKGKEPLIFFKSNYF